MAARSQRLILLLAAAIATAAAFARPATRQPDARPATRIVSLVPALTEVLFAIGAGPRVVAVSSFDQFPAEVKTLPPTQCMRWGTIGAWR